MRFSLAALLSGHAATSVMLLTRNLIVARLISVADYGIAATFAVVMALVEMSTQLGLHQQIVQSKNGDDPRLQAGLQGFQVLRGVAAGAVLFFAAEPVASVLRIPDVVWAYQVLALLPVLRAFQHFDIHRLNRRMRYGPLLWTGCVPATLSLLATVPLAFWLGDYRVMLWALVLQEMLATLTSHVFATRRYRLALDKETMVRSLRFGWPLLLNGALLFLVMQGDKVIVGRILGMEALGLFGLGVTLTLTPTLILAKSTQSFFLPQLSRAARSGSPDAFDQLASATCQAALLNGLILVLAVFALGVPLIQLLLGDKFAGLEPLLIWMAAHQALRMCKGGPSTVAVARGVTSNALYPNLVRLVGLPVAAWLLVQGGGLWHVIAVALVVEAIGYGVALGLAHLRLEMRLRPLMPSVLAVLLVILAAVTVPPFEHGAGWGGLVVLGLGVVIVWLTMRDLRTYARQSLSTTAVRRA